MDISMHDDEPDTGTESPTEASDLPEQGDSPPAGMLTDLIEQIGPDAWMEVLTGMATKVALEQAHEKRAPFLTNILRQRLGDHHLLESVVDSLALWDDEAAFGLALTITDPADFLAWETEVRFKQAIARMKAREAEQEQRRQAEAAESESETDEGSEP